MKEGLSSDQIKTFHSSKGLETKICFFYCFSELYIKLSKISQVHFQHQYNPLYVGLTRATDKLILIHDSSHQKLFHCKSEYLLKNFSYCSL